VASDSQKALISLYRAADRVRALAEGVLEPSGITGQQYNVLRILRGAEPDGLPTLTIAGRMIERAPGITRMIDRLEAKGLVARERRRGDRRCVYCRITRRGLELLRRLDQPVDELERSVFGRLTPAELARLTEALGRVADRAGK
jgi:DNA-binding MarR family transcriptional regulator